MGGRRLKASDVPTPGPWVVRGETTASARARVPLLGTGPATDDRPNGWPYLIRQDRPVEPGAGPLHIATGIPRLADAKLMAAAPDLAGTLLGLLTSPELMRHDLDLRTRRIIDVAWDLLVRVTPHLEI